MRIHMDIVDRGSLRPRVLEAQVPSVPRSHRSQGPIGPPKVSHPKVSHPRDPWEPIYGYPYGYLYIIAYISGRKKEHKHKHLFGFLHFSIQSGLSTDVSEIGNKARMLGFVTRPKAGGVWMRPTDLGRAQHT